MDMAEWTEESVVLEIAKILQGENYSSCRDEGDCDFVDKGECPKNNQCLPAAHAIMDFLKEEK